ncbi:hypothetical protein HBI56_062050 [Parastagonospora nodorum]|nr:hypothetical protein HBI09_082820 [Parastagonospora nodorum]KAH4119075.1 hypothetical protein HBH47_130940 [Parastagonospora nodorum]KAH4347448.1 hypothetical protein HBH98_093580 [Parastagonospora nodorum]KAH4388847.1 hypothetical protein HBH97_053810 [Parastagonospora nodorum]KAH4396668.1 hypothetical protein HBH99_121040 [Parastagonospora nodorum]
MSTESQNPDKIIPIERTPEQDWVYERMEQEQLYFVDIKPYAQVDRSFGILDSRYWNQQRLEALRALLGVMVMPLLEWEEEAVKTACELRFGGMWDDGRKCSANVCARMDFRVADGSE